MQSITGTGALNLRFPGQWFQLETGLHYNWHRSYDPTIGRYTQPDPLGFVDGPSVYGYAKGSPQRSVDPAGRSVADEIIIITIVLGPPIIKAFDYCMSAANKAIKKITRKSKAKQKDDLNNYCVEQHEKDSRFCDSYFAGGRNVACHNWADFELSNCKNGGPRKQWTEAVSGPGEE